ncbi:phytoene/squalene synthase family protein [Natronorubrum daqingense]|uniref:Geranylgeranyl-diphosphate geranylgeranyltransferase n=1 Tax=Natronorubrum daqingense TaxID=588898 RepID=A0A1N7CER4_9EURY|nr:phytoene/squalene synthase family protein [Natronorubrum daqingense]APX96871.1 geranylgeranyl-diphosphate geranylgeranyltransferase [Natronorubrum daqingense]SIR62141.1 phytoene synthase [Natronorubrum daqingense]
MQQEHIDASKAIQRRTGKTFYLATRFLPERVRHATHVLYAFFRIADEVVDDAGGTPPEKQAARLESLRAQALGESEPEDDVLIAFTELRERYDISDREITAFIDAMKTDIERSRYESYDELETYMRGSAAAVGVMMTAIMDPEDRQTAQPHAIKLGEAFQMTNFLRDVREDVLERDRIYVPLETLEKHGVDQRDVERLEFSESFAAAMQSELKRTERLYREGVSGIRYLPADCQLPVLLAAVLYAEHHAVIRAQGYDVLNREPSLSTARKLRCLAKTRWHWHWNRDPEAVFERVSAALSTDAGRRGPEHGEQVPTR